MADELRIDDRPDLRKPVLVTAFRGWNDGGQGASLAAGFLAKEGQAGALAAIDPRGFFRFPVSPPPPPALARHRQRDRRAANRALRPPGLTLRGADGDRRRPPRRVPPERPRLGQPL